MTRRRILHFEPAARLQQFLGRELIADPNLAVAEFVKNAYDAGATEVILEFKLKKRSTKDQCLVISDNGSGMNFEEFAANWMRPGYSAKAGSSTPVRVKTRHGIVTRIPIGEKGVGRLAAGRLGMGLAVHTRKRATDPWLQATFNWADFSAMDVPINKIPIPVTEVENLSDAAFQVGTQLLISEPTLNWAGRVPGRKALGRAETRLGRLRQDLSVLLFPLGGPHEEFTITIKHDDSSLGEYGTVTAHSAGDVGAPYTYRFEVDAAAGVVQRVLRRSAEIREVTGGRGEQRSKESLPTGSGLPLSVGSFSGAFLYSPPTLKFEGLGIEPGVYVYRDGIRVEPYGRLDDDWLGIRAKKATRQGHAPIQPNRLMGYVRISKTDTPNLIDMSNRQGLVENEAYEYFVAICRNEFVNFAEIVYSEFVTKQWTTPQERGRLAAQRAVQLSDAVVRARVHTLRQPLTALAGEIGRLSTVIKDPDLSETSRRIVSEVHERARSLAGELSGIVTDLLENPLDVHPEEFELGGAVAEAVDRVQSEADTIGARIDVSTPKHAAVVGPRSALIEALSELLRNAIQAPRENAVPQPHVGVEVVPDNGYLRIVVSDNGAGFTEDGDVDVFQPRGYSTKGRPGAGLPLTHELLALFPATIEVARQVDPTTVVVRLPSSGELRKMEREA